MSDRDLKCVHCYEDQSNYGNRVDAVFMFDGLSLCAEHYHAHRDLVIVLPKHITPDDIPSNMQKYDAIIQLELRKHPEAYLGPEIDNPSPKTTISIPYRDGYTPPQ